MSIPNLISLIRNGINASKFKITVRSSKKILSVLEILIKHKYILTYFKDHSGKVHIFFHYGKKKIIILNHFSKPSKPVYFSCQDLYNFNSHLGLILLHTSIGIISHKEAISSGLGGIVLCYIF